MLRLGIRVVGKATTSSKAVELLSEARSELLIADLEAVDGATDPLSFLRELAERFEGLRTIVLSDEDQQLIAGALAAGAVAYVVKTAHPDDLATAIRQAFGHSIYFRNSRVVGPVAPAPSATATELTRRELEILQLVAEGHSNAELGKILWVTEQTVKFHLSNIYRKLGVANRTEASRWAQIHDLLPKSDETDERMRLVGRATTTELVPRAPQRPVTVRRPA